MEKAIRELKKLKAKRIFIHFPEGIKRRIQSIDGQLKKEGFETVWCLEATWGSCDVRVDEAKRLGCDVVLHIGHSDYGVKTDIPVVYADYFIDADPIPTLEKEFSKIGKFKNIGLVTSVQFVPAFKKVKEFLKSKGKNVFTCKSQQYEGQMLGCRITAGKMIEDKVDCFLCVTAGKFYGLGLALGTDKPVFDLDLEMQKIHDMNQLKNKIEKIEAWNISALKHARKIGLLVSWKRGQMLGSPFLLKKRFEDEGKEVILLAFDELSPEKLEGLKLDAIISFACPRIATDDLSKYKIPMINYMLLMRDLKKE